MNFNGTILQPPSCVFGGGIERSGEERFQGLRASGPYDASHVPTAPRFLFVFPDEFNDLANTVYHSLKSGNNPFPGMNALFGVTVSRDLVSRVGKFSIAHKTTGEAAALYSAAIEQHLGKGNSVDFAIVICDKTEHEAHPSPYYSSKLTLAAHGIPSQIITSNLLTSQNLTWALADIGLQIFVKLGGHPWFVRPSPGAGDIIVGIGRSERTDARGKITRYVGYTTCFTAGGLFKSVEIFQPQAAFTDYLSGLENSVIGALKKVVQTQTAAIRLVLHVPKKFSYLEREKVESALQTFQRDAAIQYVVLRLNEEHHFTLFDLTHPTMAPTSGISVEIDRKERLLLLAGRPISGNIRKPPSAPLWVTLQTANTTETSIDALVQQIYELSVANWRGFNAKARPITTHYSRLIAELLSASDGNVIIQAISNHSNIQSVPWFI